jgi:hypothetical protein
MRHVKFLVCMGFANNTNADMMYHQFARADATSVHQSIKHDLEIQKTYNQFKGSRFNRQWHPIVSGVPTEIDG